MFFKIKNKKLFKRTVNLIIVCLLVGFGFFILANTTFAEFGLEYATVSGLGTRGLKSTVFTIINVILGFLGIAAIVILIYGGFVWMTAGGNDQKISQAKKILLNGLIGLFIILVSWGIANFVLSQLWQATGGGPTAGSPCDCATDLNICSGCLRCQTTAAPDVCTWQSDATCDPSCIGFPGAKTFYAQKFQPTSPPDAIRNAVVRITFKGLNTSSQPGAINYGANFSVLNVTDGNILVAADAVGGYPKVVDNRLEFRPETACPAPYESYKCFDANKDYKIVVTNTLQNTAGINLDCAGYSCEAAFRANDIIDTKAPTISVSMTNQICANTAFNDVDAFGADDSGIAYIEFYYNDGATDTLFETDNTPACVGLPPNVSCSAQANWDTTAPQFSAGGTYFLKAKAMDLDSNEKMSSAYKVILRAAHCCNGIQDTDEAAIDCGGADCAACDGAACDVDASTPGCQPDDMTCASVFCDPSGCICQSPPIIDYVIPGDGAEGNFITLWGRNFGAIAGAVRFLGGAGADASFPSAVNPSCGNTWTNNQIIVVAPAGAADGPLRVTTSAGYSDQTDDSRGPIIADFDVNNAVRPGLCQANPASGFFAALVNLTGVRFGPAAVSRTVEFGNDILFMSADNIVWNVDNQNVNLTVPNLKPAKVGLRVKVDNEYSNYLSFTVLAGAAGGPHINYIDPTSGPENQYVTIFGSNFGNKVGIVTFGGLTAKTDFPVQCQNNFWRDSYIIVKAPNVTAGANYPIQVKTFDGKLSNDDVIFIGAAGAPGPGICALSPDNGPVNTPVNFYGDNFGAAPGQAVFYNNQPATTISSWANQAINANAPLGAISGAVFVEDNSALPKKSNRLPFRVGACEDDSQCDTSVPEKCCADYTCRAICPEKVIATYGWSFTTGDYFVAKDCNKDIGIPATGPTGKDVCVNAQIAARFTTLVNDNTVVDAGDPTNHPNVIVEKCADDACAATTPVSGAVTLTVLNTVPLTEGFVFTQLGSLDQGATYKITLRGGEGGIKDEAGVPLIDDYIWTFKTRNDNQQCQIGSIKVEPSKAKLVMLGATQNYLATLVSKENSCLLINTTAYIWAWESSDTKVAAVSGSANNIETATSLGTGETQIKATIASENKSGSSRLTVDLSGLLVLNVTPTCDTACANAQIRSRFSNRIDDTTLTSTNIRLYNCGLDKSCLNFSALPLVALNNPATTYFWNNLTGDSILDLNPTAGQLNPNTYYRAFIKGGPSGIKNYQGGPLSNPNFKAAVGEECDPPGANCSAICLRASGECAPGSIGCDAAGLHTGSLATCGNGAVDQAIGENCDPNAPGFGPGGCDSSSCLLRGSIFPALCGDGLLDQLHGEACDDTNQTNGDGCSDKCLHEGTMSPTCGNGAIDLGEDCDDGNTQTGDGCSARCLSEGSSVCGDRQIGAGEDCDDGNTQSGDGCSGNCLNEGSTGLAVCGNGVVENGKFNDSYSWVFGAGSGPCQPESAEIIPSNTTASVGEKINYLSNLYSAPDECSAQGQSLDAGAYAWQWTSDNLGVATVSGSATEKETATASGIGAAQICATGDINKDAIFAAPPDVSDCADLIVSQITSGPGTPCRQTGNSCCQTGVSLCSTGLACLWDESQNVCPFAGVSPSPPTTKPGCLCCCDPADDQCPAPLNCYADKAPCAGANRGMCCGCKSDADCDSLPGSGCGKDTCCHARPQVSGASPANGQNNVCRNIKIRVDFNEPMQTSSFISKVEMIKISDGSPVKGVTSSGSNTILYFSPQKPLEENAAYQVTIKKEVLSQYQIAMAADYVFSFTTGGLICDADYLRVSITHGQGANAATVVANRDLFTCVRNDCPNTDDTDNATAGNQHFYLAEAVDLTGQVLSSYDYSWSDTDPDDIVSHNTTANPNIIITANNKNGRATYNATAVPQIGFGNVGNVANRVYITNFICENPWPGISDWPWVDDSANPDSSCNAPIGCTNFDTHFQLMYCRDAGGPGADDDLPPLPNPPVIRGKSGSILKEFLFVSP